jgi:hypothetical protein
MVLMPYPYCSANLSGGRLNASSNLAFGCDSGGTGTYSNPAAFIQAAVASSTLRCLASSSSVDPAPPARTAIRIPPPGELTKPSPMYSASGLLSLF